MSVRKLPELPSYDEMFEAQASSKERRLPEWMEESERVNVGRSVSRFGTDSTDS